MQIINKEPNYKFFPPIKNLVLVLKECPISALLYIQLWELLLKQDEIVVHTKKTTAAFGIVPHFFKRRIINLHVCLLLSCELKNGYWHIRKIGQ